MDRDPLEQKRKWTDEDPQNRNANGWIEDGWRPPEQDRKRTDGDPQNKIVNGRMKTPETESQREDILVQDSKWMERDLKIADGWMKTL